MNDWNIYLILLNLSFTILLIAFLAKDIVWLRILTISGNLIAIPYYFSYFENPLWNPMAWIGVYTLINIVMLFLLYLERRPVKLTDQEKEIYELSFRSIPPRVFKNLINQANWEHLGPEVQLINRDTQLDNLYMVVEGRAEVILKNGEHKYIPAGGFIGEQSYITESKTSADVTTGEEKTTLLKWDKKKLRIYLEHYETLKHTFDLILTTDLIFKLRNMDQKQQKIAHSSI